MNMICKCGSKEFFTEKHGNQTGLYCSACGKWQKWLKKDEIRLFNHGVKNGWISVNDKLPNNDEDVIALSDSGDSLVCRYNNDMKRWEKYGFTLNMNFIYWRELYKIKVKE